MATRSLISNATESDIPRIIDHVEALVVAVRGPQRVCRIATGETIARLIHAPTGAVLVTPRGFIAGEIGRTIISPDLVAFELGWFAADRTGIALLRAFERWSAEQGATLIKMTSNGGDAQRILERCGYAASEVQCTKRLT